jgi:hypothetical protein
MSLKPMTKSKRRVMRPAKSRLKPQLTRQKLLLRTPLRAKKVKRVLKKALKRTPKRVQTSLDRCSSSGRFALFVESRSAIACTRPPFPHALSVEVGD